MCQIKINFLFIQIQSTSFSKLILIFKKGKVKLPEINCCSRAKSVRFSLQQVKQNDDAADMNISVYIDKCGQSFTGTTRKHYKPVFSM